MVDSACVMNGYSYNSAIPNDTKQVNHMQVLGDSVSFGRFMNEPLSWEKWSTFSHKKYVEEAESYTKPGSVAQKKALFEAHYKRKAAQKAAAEQVSAANGTVVEGLDDNANNNNNNSSQRISLKLDSYLVVDEKMDMVKIPDEMNDCVENGKATSLVAVAEDVNDQKKPEEITGTKKYSGGEAPRKKVPHKKRFFSKYLCNLYGLFHTEGNGGAPLKTTEASIEGVSKNPAATPPSNNRRKKTPPDSSAPGSNKTRRKWPIFCSLSKTSRNHRSPTLSK